MATLLSVDIWDTLIRRRCHPDEVKLFTARALWWRRREQILGPYAGPWRLVDARVAVEAAIASEREGAGLDNEYTIEEVFGRWLETVLHPGVPASDRRRLAERLVHAEVEQERLVGYADERMLRLLATHDADRLVGLSDFYMGERHLRRIVEHVCGGSPFDRLFVSSDVGVNKMRGRLFAHAQRETLARPEHHTHIGDNQWADVESPRRFGVRAVHYQHEAEEARRRAHRARLEARRRGDFVPTAQLLRAELRRTCRAPRALTDEQRELYELGFRTAPVWAGLVLGALHEAHALGCPAVHYCTREGEFFRRVHDAMAPERPSGFPEPRSEVIEVSRLATFLPSLGSVSTEEMMRVWRQYRTQSMSQLLRTLDCAPMPFEPLFARSGVDPDRPVHEPWKDAGVRRLFADPLFRRLVERHRDRRRALLVEYLRSRGFGTGPAVLVDIGWRGTIQDNLCRVFPGRRIAGWYLALDHFRNPQPGNGTKQAISIDARRDPEALMQVVYNVSPLEMLANTATGSVRGYERRPDGAVGAVRVHDGAEDEVWEGFTRHYQRGVIDAAPLVARWARTFAVDHREMRPMIIDMVRTLKAAPPPVLARAYFSLRHNETFGVGGFKEKRAELDPALLRRGEASGGSDPEFVRAIESTDWPQGLLRLLGRDELCRRYNAFREDRSRRIDRRLAARRTAETPPDPARDAPSVTVVAGNGRAQARVPARQA